MRKGMDQRVGNQRLQSQLLQQKISNLGIGKKVAMAR